MRRSTMSERSKHLLETVPEAVDAVVLSPGETLRYFTELVMHKSERPTLVILSREDRPAAVLPKLETDRARGALPDADFYTYGEATDPVVSAREAFEQLAVDRGFEGPFGAEFRSTRLLESSVFVPETAEVVDVSDAISTLRTRKDDDEIEKLRTAVEIVEEIIEAALNEIEPGMTEQDIVKRIQRRVVDSNADTFGLGMVTAGERTAYPHANTSARAIKKNEPVMIDAGVVYEGYHSDITRTVAVGDPGEEFRDLYEVVKEAAAVARETVAPGVEAQAVDRAAREVIEEAGYGEYFPHRVGHGIGLEGHEPPYLVEGNDSTLKLGHAVTIEPGVYVPDLGGVRIEDDVVVDEEGADVLSTSTRDLRHL